MMTDKNSKKRNTRFTPLGIIALFLSFAETALVTGVIKTTGGIQITFTVFTIFFPILVAGCFFIILWKKPYAFYPPSEFGDQTDVGRYVEAMSRDGTEQITEKRLLAIAHQFSSTIPTRGKIPMQTDNGLFVEPKWSIKKISDENKIGHIIFGVKNTSGKKVVIYGYRMFRISPNNHKDLFYFRKISDANEIKGWNTSSQFRMILSENDERSYHWNDVDIPKTYGLKEKGRWGTEVQIAYIEQGTNNILYSIGRTFIEVE